MNMLCASYAAWLTNNTEVEASRLRSSAGKQSGSVLFAGLLRP